VRPDDFRETPPALAGERREGVSFEIAAAATAPPEPARLDPKRAAAEPEAPPAGRQRGLALGVVGSLAVHLAPLLLLLSWTGTPAEIVEPIPVQLVIEEPPPPPPPPPKAEEFKPPPPGRLASEDMGQTASPPPDAAAAPPAPQPAPTQVAAAVPPPPPSPPPPQPAPTQIAAAIPPPKPVRPPKPGVAAFQWHRLDILPQAAPRETRVPGPAATRDEYLAYCMTLIRRRFAALSPGFLAGRRGSTVFRLEVLDNGTIARITLAQGSPYPDIDARIAEAVKTVGRFPPLPQWLQGVSAGLILQVSYPDGL